MAKRFWVTMRTGERLDVEAHSFTPYQDWIQFADIDGNFVSMIQVEDVKLIEVERPTGLKAVA
jgi:hypothetical protein